MLDLGIVQQRHALQHRDLGDDIHHPALQGHDLGLDVGVEAELGPFRQRLRAPIIGIAHEGGAHLGRVFLQLEGAGADEILLEVPGIIGRQDDGVVVVRRDVIGKIAVRRVEMEFDRIVVHLLRAALGQHAAEGRERVGGILRIGEAIDRRDHVIRRHRLAVVEFHALAQLEGPDRSVLIGLPALGQHRAEPQIAGGERQIFARLAEHDDAAGIGTVTGSMAPEGVVWATRTVPAVAARAICGAAKDPIPPAAASSSGADMPSTVPWRRNSRRPICPARNSSIRSFSTSLDLRRSSSRYRPKLLISSAPCLLALLPCPRRSSRFSCGALGRGRSFKSPPTESCPAACCRSRSREPGSPA